MAVRDTANNKAAPRAKTSKKRPNSITVAVLGAGAPHAGLMAGALAHIYRKSNKTFDVFFTSGGGALISLLFVAPNNKPADEALRDVAEFGIDDRIYRIFPVGYKTFFKNSRFTGRLHEWAQRFKLDVEPRPFPGEDPPAGYDPKEERRRRLFNDGIDFWASALTPPMIGPTSLGLCSHLPFLEDMVDFDRLRLPSPSGRLGGWFFVNAYNLDTKTINQFSNEGPIGKPPDTSKGFAGPLTPLAIRAALSFPFVYPPERVNGAVYCEGADVDPLNLPNLRGVISRGLTSESRPRRDESDNLDVYLFDILGSLEKDLMCPPRDLWEAYGLSILTPVVSLAKMSQTIYRQNKGNPIPVPFEIPRNRRGRPLDWSYSNTTAMWDAGWKAGEKFLDDYGDDLPERVDP